MRGRPGLLLLQLCIVVSALSAVEGISETLLIVSHDGFYEDVNAVVESIRFCQGEGFHYLVAEKVGNVGYAFNRTVWERIHFQAKPFCVYDDYNWDVTIWRCFGDGLYTLRGPRSSAIHFGKCGLHVGFSKLSSSDCRDSAMHLANHVRKIDKVPNINPEWPVQKYPSKYLIKGYAPGFQGWGDTRDHHLCLSFSSMYDKPLDRS